MNIVTPCAVQCAKAIIEFHRSTAPTPALVLKLRERAVSGIEALVRSYTSRDWEISDQSCLAVRIPSTDLLTVDVLYN